MSEDQVINKTNSNHRHKSLHINRHNQKSESQNIFLCTLRISYSPNSQYDSRFYRTLVIELQLEGIKEIRERHQTIYGIVHQNDSTGKGKEKHIPL